MLFVQSYVGGDVLLGDKTADPGRAGFDHALVDLQLPFGEPQYLVTSLGQFGRHRYRLHGCKGGSSSRSGSSLDPSGWSDACSDRTVVHVDWPVDVEDPRRMCDFTVRHPYGEDDAATLERLAVYVRFVLHQPTTEYAVPQPRLTHPDPALVKHADVVGMKATGLQRFDSGLRVSAVSNAATMV
jgi:hypothetical protein